MTGSCGGARRIDGAAQRQLVRGALANSRSARPHCAPAPRAQSRLLLAASSAVVALVLLSPAARSATDPLAVDRGAAGAWQRIQKLRTTASLMHTTAHPDDEHGGMLAAMSRGRGARVSLLTLTRGESGDNAIGPELFDAVGLIRTEELRTADRYYGVDRQYFTTAIDYGFSKRLEEALLKWGRDNVLRDMVRVIRLERPFVVVARFQGNERDGHGNHQAAGLLTQEAFRVAGDPNVFPEQIREGLRPWQPLKLYMGGVRENEDWSVRINTGEYSPWLGDTYGAFARIGLAFQRSQNGGQVPAPAAAAELFYRRLATAPWVHVAAGGAEASFFDGIDITIPGLFGALGHPAPPQGHDLLEAIDGEVQEAIRAFSIEDPAASVPALARGLAATRAAIAALPSEPDAAFVLATKEQQFADAIKAALGLDLQATAQLNGPAVGGQQIAIDVAFANRGAAGIDVESVDLVAEDAAGWRIDRRGSAPDHVQPRTMARASFAATVAASAPITRPYFERASLAESRYTVRDARDITRPASEPALSARVVYRIGGVSVEARAPVRRRESRPPYGDELRELAVVPAVTVNVTPRTAILRRAHVEDGVDVVVEVLNNATAAAGQAVAGAVALRVPPGWTATPGNLPVSFSRPGERATLRAHVTPPSGLPSKDYPIEAVATIGGREYRESCEVVDKRDLETRYLYRPAGVLIRAVDVEIAPNLKVGYVMGIGDEVPAAIAQLGVTVTLLGEQDLARGDLRRFDAIVTGTRAYAVRDDLRTNNRRLLDYAHDGGNLIVLYNTQELVPNTFAPYPGVLTARAEEVSEEDSPVDVLAPQHRVMNVPNRITSADFAGWLEQRGSKFWSEWDPAYTPIIATHDTGQPWQAGGWLTADYGKGHYTYFAYALHRQLPFGVPGAYRLLANLLSVR